MKNFEILLVSIDFWSNFLIFSLALPHTSPYFEIFLKFPLNFRENLGKIFKESQNFLKIFKKL